MTVNIANTKVCHVSDKKVSEEEEVPAAYGSLDLSFDIFSQGCKVCKAGFDLATAVLVGITKKKEPRSPHMIIIDAMEGRL